MADNAQRKTGTLPGDGDGDGDGSGSGLDGTGTGTGDRLNENELDEEREAPIGGDVEFDANLDAFLSEHNAEQLPARVTLFRYKNPAGSETGPRVQIDEWQNFVPSWHEIGVKHGSGKYIVQITIPKGRKQRKTNATRSRVLDAHYDILKQEALNRNYSGGVPLASGQAAPPSKDQSLVIIERLAAIFGPIITAFLARQNTPLDPGSQMVSMYTAMNQLFKRQAEENMALLGQVTRDRLDAGYEEGADDLEDLPEAVPQPSTLQQIMPFIQQVAGMLMGGGVKATAARTMVQAAPGFKDVLKNPGEMKKIIAYLDKQYGPDKTTAMLKQLKIGRPK